MEAHEIVTHFLNTGKLPDGKEIKREDYLDDKGHLKGRDYFGDIMRAQSSLFKLSEDELLLLIEIDPFDDFGFVSFTKMFISYYPEKFLSLLKDKEFLKTIFEEKNKDFIRWANFVTETFLGMIGLQDQYLQEDDMEIYNYSQYVKFNENYLLVLKEKIIEIEKEEIEKEIASYDFPNAIIKDKLIGFDTNLSTLQIDQIYNKLNDKIFRCSKEDFIALCKKGELKQPVKWILINSKGTPNKETLFTFVKHILHQLEYTDKFENSLIKKTDELFKYKGRKIFNSKFSRPNANRQKSNHTNHFKGLHFKKQATL